MELNKAWEKLKEVFNLDDSRKGPSVIARDAFCFSAHLKGFDYDDIGKVVKRDRTTIYACVSRHSENKSYRYSPKTYKRYNDFLEKAKMLIDGQDIATLSVEQLIKMDVEIKELKSEIYKLKNVIKSKNQILRKNGIDGKYRRPIVQLSREGVYINSFDSISEAARRLNIKHVSTIQKVVLGERPTAYGYKFEYADE